MKRLLPCLLLVGNLAAAPASLDELLQQVRSERTTEQRHNQAREARFLADRDRQRERLDALKAELAQAEAQADELRSRHAANQARVLELETQLRERAGDLNDLFAVARQVAADTRAQLDASLISAQLPGRVAALAPLSDERATLTTPQLEALWVALLEEMTESGKVARFQAPVISAAGTEAQRAVVRIGAFTALSEGRYLRYLPETGRLVEPARQPAARLQAMALDLEQAVDGMHPVAVDPSRGALLGLLVQTPDLGERIRQGGPIGYLILALGAIGLLIVAERYLVLGWVRWRLTRDGDRPGPVQALQAAARQEPGLGLEALGLRLDDLVAGYARRWRRGLPTLAILAAVAPLLGLLGTVTGMIETFQSITLFGTGDPKLMSGGISEALVTTQLGLVVAIPIVLLHSFLNGRATGLVNILDGASTRLLTARAQSLGDA